MGRSVKKGPFVAPELIKRVNELNKTGEKRVLKTWSRASTIFPQFVGTYFCRARRQKACACVCHRRHGRP